MALGHLDIACKQNESSIKKVKIFYNFITITFKYAYFVGNLLLVRLRRMGEPRW